MQNLVLAYIEWQEKRDIKKYNRITEKFAKRDDRRWGFYGRVCEFEKKIFKIFHKTY